MSNPSVLIFDKDSITCNIIQGMLKDTFLLQIAKDIDSFYKIINYDITDLVICHVDNFKKDSISFLKEVTQAHPLMPIMLLADEKFSEENEATAISLGVSDVIRFPYKKDIIIAKLFRFYNLKQQFIKLSSLANQDDLTKLYNRYYFNEVFKNECDRAVRNQDTISIIMIDIDYFKSYNDIYGHIQGDDALKKVSNILKKSCKRPGDVAARFGGEEFTILLPRTNKVGSLIVAERIKNCILKCAIEHSGSPFNKTLTVSIGSVTAIYDKELIFSPDLTLEMLKAADEALYKAKNKGRNTLHQEEVFYSSNRSNNSSEEHN